MTLYVIDVYKENKKFRLNTLCLKISSVFGSANPLISAECFS